MVFALMNVLIIVVEYSFAPAKLAHRQVTITITYNTVLQLTLRNAYHAPCQTRFYSHLVYSFFNRNLRLLRQSSSLLKLIFLIRFFSFNFALTY